ncbi:DUF533 domain-containing protein [Dokdonella sp.]|uniref:YcjF family protein n=1 Tax=Dokdonella sp. TaxID=2291710 RepID=UPI001B03C29D|nr:DUF533 domain-containing protein [Dokdonella sp.]MBO9663556.1 DUF533 domain-containing protein [Dokdonella sp.]
MSEQENRSILTISLMASFADGATDERERNEVRRIAEGLGGSGLDVAGLYQDVLLKRVDLDDAVAGLASPQTRQLAYEMAVCVCGADGARSDAEGAFLADLATRLGLDPASSREYSAQAEAIASAPLGAAGSSGGDLAASPAAPQSSATAERPSSMSDAEMDKAILNAAILNGALELLPESLATMAIIPLQMKLVYRIGQSYGYELDRGHIKDFLATAGVGLTSQYIEQAGRKLLGGLLGAIGGGFLGGLGRQAVSSGMSFASTYALGHVAQRYYAGGRVLSTEMLRTAFEQMLGEAKGLQANYLPQMQEQARSLNPAKILQMVRGG